MLSVVKKKIQLTRRVASSTGLLLKTLGLKVTAIKIDPYMNIDAGTMRPTEHGEFACTKGASINNCDTPPGEVYVLNDGGEVDLDLGNYERYLNVTLSRDNNITTGKIYREVIEKEVSRFLRGGGCRNEPEVITAERCLPRKNRANRSTRHWRHTRLDRARGQDPGGRDGRGAGCVYRRA